MDIRDSFSRLKKKLKLPLAGSRHKPGRAGAGCDGDPTNSLPRPKPHVVDHDREEARSTDRLSQPNELEPVPAHGSENGRGEREGRGVSQKDSHPRPNVEAGAGSGHGREGDDDSGEEVERVYPSLPAPSIPYDGEIDGM